MSAIVREAFYPLCRRGGSRGVSAIEFAMQAATIAAVIGLGFWFDRRVARFYRLRRDRRAFGGLGSEA